MLKTITSRVAVASVALLLFLQIADTHGELLCPVDDPECKNRREASLEEKVKQSPPDHQAAMKWMREAAQQGDEAAQKDLQWALKLSQSPAGAN